MIEDAENFLRDEGFRDVRVRHHEAGQGAWARIELGPTEFPKLLSNGTGARIAGALRQVGYLHVVLDLLGYRRGSTNEVNGPTQTRLITRG
jgi:uncharacterized protein